MLVVVVAVHLAVRDKCSADLTLSEGGVLNRILPRECESGYARILAVGAKAYERLPQSRAAKPLQLRLPTALWVFCFSDVTYRSASKFAACLLLMRQNELRSALYHRFHRLVPLVAHPAARRLWRIVVGAFWFAYFGFVLAVLILRYSILPNIENFRGDIEGVARRGLGLAVSIGRIEASWEGINPDLTLLDVRIDDPQGRPALAFSRVETILSWWSVPKLQLTLRLLRIDAPTLHLRRESDGGVFIAGIPLSQQSSDGDAADWILAQRRIRISGATVVWEDALRDAPTLVLEDVNLSLDNDGARHRFGLTAVPSVGMMSSIDLRGDFRGRDFDALESWKGQVYAQLDDADLAIWRNWIDYPLALTQGRGGVRAWVGFAGGVVRELMADLSLREASLQWAGDLPAVAVESMSGRIGVKFLDRGMEVSGHRFALTTHARKATESGVREAIRISPTDFYLRWRDEPGENLVVGEATASSLNLEVLGGLGVYLPVDAHTRQLLQRFAPRGTVSDLRATWRGDAEHLQAYTMKARFDDMALAAQGKFPGFLGISGSIDASEQGGSVTLGARKSSIDLPSVFPESLISLDSLNAQARWKIKNGLLDVDLKRVEFAGPDGAGSVQGNYRTTGSGPGVIDLTAALTRGDGRAVWRYMPHAVNATARQWLRNALQAGTGSNAKLVLKGDLRYFPFVDKKNGQFLVTAKARDVVLDYAPGWPPITGIAGDLRFEGAGMVIDASKGAIFGAQIEQARAVIPDFDLPVTTLTVKGRAAGPTAEFLRFVQQSPVGDRIDHVTDDMSAKGDGRLDIGLVLPLDPVRILDSRVEGSYRMLANEVIVDPALPPFRQVNGTVQFTASDLRIPEIRATLFDGPLVVKGGTQRDGRVLITADGSLNVAQLGKQSELAVFDKLSGVVKYRGEVRVKKRSADLTIDSNLVGLTSALPEPFGKAADEALPLHFEKIFLPGVTQRSGDTVVRDQIEARLGDTVVLQMIRRKRADEYVVEKGSIAVGRPLQMPERGVMFAVTAKRLDADVWRQVFRRKSASVKGGDSGSVPPGLPISAFNLKADALVLFGRTYADVDLLASATTSLWQIYFGSREAAGELLWEAAGHGKLTARMKRLAVEPFVAGESEPPAEAIEELPALDIVADDFSIGKRRFGRLEVQARNEGQNWLLERIQLSNPYGSLSGNGQWRIGPGVNRTRLDFMLESSDIGKLLDRLGYPGAVRGGTAAMEGRISWNGPPAGLDYPTLSGEMKVEAAKGQFVKLDPGAGKLLGLISLQALPRRIGLDFRDVFSDGFAFDSIAGNLSVHKGTMRTDRLQIDGPAARIVMRGETDLQHETERLNVNVQPDLGSTAAFGVALVNPLAGVATLLAHKVLQNPLNRMFGFDYLVTGTWDDPKVEKLSRFDQSANPLPRLPTIPNQPGGSHDTAQ